MKFGAYAHMPTVEFTPVIDQDAWDIAFGPHHQQPEFSIRLDFFQMCALFDAVQKGNT